MSETAPNSKSAAEAARSIARLKHLVFEQPDRLRPRHALAQAYCETGQLDRAIELANRLIIRHPGRAIFHEVLDQAVSKRQEERPRLLPVHFFTIVLNGMPFIRYHLEAFHRLPFPWTWHIIEGVADMNRDSAWPKEQGGAIPESCHKAGLSIDGTSEYLDEIASADPERVRLYRPPPGQFWPDKTEMIQQPLLHDTWRDDECLLWQVDADELWRPDQIARMRRAFLGNPRRMAAVYQALYFVGGRLVLQPNYAGQKLSWPRTWRYRPGFFWHSHEPPTLVQWCADRQYRRAQSFDHFKFAETTEMVGLFQHYAYVTTEQIDFKEQYYGYGDLMQRWQALQNHQGFPVKLKEYWPYHWVPQEAPVIPLEESGQSPLAWQGDDDWEFAR